MPRGKARADAILLATRVELEARGYEAMTIDAVAARARSSKATIYRRWRNKAELVKAMLDALDAADNAAIPATGALRSDLVAVVVAMGEKANAAYVAMIQDLVLASKRDPVLADALRRHVDDGQLSPFLAILERYVRRRDADFDLVHDVAEGLIVRRLQAGRRVDAAFARRIVDQVLLPVLAAKRGKGLK